MKVDFKFHREIECPVDKLNTWRHIRVEFRQSLPYPYEQKEL